jgi:hypothetical protein
MVSHSRGAVHDIDRHLEAVRGAIIAALNGTG